MSSCIFTNDDNVSILLLNHCFTDDFKKRNNNEILFRRINTFLIKNNIIKNNIIDLGAWIGDNSIPWAKNINGIVYAIDPSADNCNFIKKMCELNEIKNINILQNAISNTNEMLSTNDDINHCSFVYRYCGLNGINKIISVSLDYLYENKLIENIGYIHLDVEGMEHKVLQGSSMLIDTDRPIISFETHLEIDDCAGILLYLTNKQYKVFLIDEILPMCRHDCRNSFAFPNEIYNEDLIKNINNFIGINILQEQ
jgi:FkbM family methyltransferase